ncbi:MAG: hypothetical protein R3F46_08825 [bacterium]
MILCLDSSGPGVQFSLTDDSAGELGCVVAEPRSELSRDMSGLYALLLDAAGLEDGSGIKRILVGQGPGTFIGTRVALSFANGLASASGMALAQFDSLRAMQLSAGNPLALALRDARRGQYYICDGQLTRLIDEPKLTELLDSAEHVVSDKVPEVLQQDRSLAHMQDLLARCSGRLQWLDRLPAGAMLACAEPCPEGYAEPVYLRGYL